MPALWGMFIVDQDIANFIIGLDYKARYEYITNVEGDFVSHILEFMELYDTKAALPTFLKQSLHNKVNICRIKQAINHPAYTICIVYPLDVLQLYTTFLLEKKELCAFLKKHIQSNLYTVEYIPMLKNLLQFAIHHHASIIFFNDE